MSPYDHPDWDALLRGIAATPDADLPRLVAADWLDENGDPDRAAFIRLQCERALNDTQELKWLEEGYRNSPVGIPQWAVEACPNIVRLDFTDGSPLGSFVGVESVTFRRGFPERVNCSAAEWARYGHLVVPRQPVRGVVLRRCLDPDLDWWAMFPTLRLMGTVALEAGDYRLLQFLRRHLPGVDIARHSPPPTPAAPVPSPLPVAPPPRRVERHRDQPGGWRDEIPW